MGVVGGMASGKSTLISALSGEIKKTRGSLNVFDKVVYVPNRPWLKSGTIRDNISFGANTTQQSINRSKLYEKVNDIFQQNYIFAHYSKSQIFVQKFNFDKTPNIFTSFSPKLFLTIFLVKSKLTTAKKSRTTTFSRVFHPKIDIFQGKSKLNFWTKNEDFEQCDTG